MMDIFMTGTKILNLGLKQHESKCTGYCNYYLLNT
jgi:hypothetical protein